MKYYSILALTIIASMQVHANDATATDKVWKTSAELGAITTSGNTAGTSVTGKIDAKQELAQWSNQYIFSAFFKEDEKTDDNGDRFTEKSAQRYLISAKTAYKLEQEYTKLFAFGSYTDDEFGAYTEYTTVAVGYGSRLYNDDDKSLDTEIGPGYFTGKRSSGETERGFIMRGAASFNWTISESAAFAQTLSVEYGNDNTRTIAETSLQAKVNGSLQMKAAFLVQNDSDVPEGKKSTDTQTSLTLVYSF
jgi:putative salt-induced outer membrane protein